MAPPRRPISLARMMEIYGAQFNGERLKREAGEAKKEDEGLRIRIDMPGTAAKTLKLKMDKETKAVVVSAVASKEWDSDSGRRVYKAKVFLDGDDVRMPDEAKLENGCLKLLFKGASGSLFTFTGINSTDLADFDPEDKELQEEVLPSPPARGFFLVRKNPFIVKGIKGPQEMKFITRNTLYIRLDLPDVGPGQEVIGLQDNETNLLYGTDEAGQTLLGQFVLGCGCCKLGLPRHEMKNGVLRMMLPKITEGPCCSYDIQNWRPF
ncbi:hypothetical protein AKJ16_DCAP16201 [Drosera capensis]